MRFRGFFEHKLIIAKEIQQRIDDSAGLGINASSLYNYQVPTDTQTNKTWEFLLILGIFWLDDS